MGANANVVGEGYDGYDVAFVPDVIMNANFLGCKKLLCCCYRGAKKRRPKASQISIAKSKQLVSLNGSCPVKACGPSKVSDEFSATIYFNQLFGTTFTFRFSHGGYGL